MTVPKLIRDNKVAVLVSAGYGAGWYSWHGDERLLFDPKIVEMLEAEADFHDIEIYCESTYGDEIYYGGLYDLCVKWIPVGSQFQVTEYDGAESLTISHEVKWITA